MFKILATFFLLLCLSCSTSKYTKEKKYYPDGYSLNVVFDTTSKRYQLGISEMGVFGLIPEFDSIIYKNNILTIDGYVIYPRIHIANKPSRVENVDILYVEEKEIGKLILIDSLRKSDGEGKFILRIQNPIKKFYLLFMKDSLISCAHRFNSKIKRK